MRRVSFAGKTLQVKIGGEAKTLQVQDVVHLFQRNEKVHYTDPVDGQHRVATVVEAQGDHWCASRLSRPALKLFLTHTFEACIRNFFAKLPLRPVLSMISSREPS